MKMPKTGPAEEELFSSLLPDSPEVTRRKMFGQWAGFVNGNMFLCLFGDRIAVKLSEADAAELMKVEGAGPFAPMENRPMKGYVMLPLAWHEDRSPAEEWVKRSTGFVATLPPKPPKKGK